MVGIIGCLLFGIVLTCLVFSKLTFLTLLSAIAKGMNVPPTTAMAADGHQAFVMVALAIFVPQGWALFLSLWKWGYRARARNPNPSYRACFWNIILTLCEVVGVAGLCFSLGPRVASLDVLAAMHLVFGGTLYTWVRRKRTRDPESIPLLAAGDYHAGGRGTSASGITDHTGNWQPSAAEVRVLGRAARGSCSRYRCSLC
jgi:hypothetical protein